MANVMTGDKALLQQAADSTYSNLTQLEKNLNDITKAQLALHDALVSEHTGPAAQAAFDNAISKGKQLAGTLQHIMDGLHSAGVNVDAQDMQNKGKLNASGNLTPDVGGAMGKIDLSKIG
jgi:hypothetical protein